MIELLVISHHGHDDVFYARFLIMTTSESEPPCVLGCQYIKPHSLQMLLLTIPDVLRRIMFFFLFGAATHISSNSVRPIQRAYQIPFPNGIFPR